MKIGWVGGEKLHLLKLLIERRRRLVLYTSLGMVAAGKVPYIRRRINAPFRKDTFVYSKMRVVSIVFALFLL